MVNHPDRVEFLWHRLKELELAGHIAFPSSRNKDAWLPEMNPRLPTWILLKRATESDKFINPHQVSWLPELAFCTELKNPTMIDCAITINNYLIENRGKLVPAPLRERSLQIFGNEKRLDTMVQGGFLFGGRLPISQLFAFQVDPPLIYTLFEPLRKPVLIIENHHTYWSFCKWNLDACQYSAIVYGCGNAIVKSGRSLASILSKVDTQIVEYFGDIDSTGLFIPVQLNEEDSLPVEVSPAIRFYLWLLEHGIRRTASPAESRFLPGTQEWTEKFDAEIQELFDANHWLPQEGLGIEALMQFFV